MAAGSKSSLLPLSFWGVTLLALALRLFRLGHQSFWADEIASVYAGQTPLGSMIGWYLVDPHPPLFYTLVKVMLLFGESEFVLRLLPLLAGTGAVAYTWLLGRSLLGERKAAIGALLLALTPLAVWTSQDLRSSSLLCLFAAASTYYLVRYQQEGGRRLRRAYIATTILLCLSHYFAVFVLACHLAWTFFRPQDAKDGYRKTLAAFVWIGVGLLFWLPFFVMQLLKHGQYFRVEKGLGKIGQLLLYYFTTSHSPWHYETLIPKLRWLLYNDTTAYSLIMPLVLLPFWLPVLVGVLRGLRFKGGERVLSFYLIFQIILVLTATRLIPLFEPRYFVCALPFFCLLTASGLVRVWDWKRLPAAVLAVCLIALQAISLYHLYFDPGSHKADWKKVAAAVVAKSNPDDALLLYHRNNSSDFLYYYQKRFSGSLPIYEMFEIKGAIDSPVVTLADQVIGPLERIGPGRVVWFADMMSFLYDPQEIALATIRRDYSETDALEARKAMGFYIRRFEPRPEGTNE